MAACCPAPGPYEAPTQALSLDHWVRETSPGRAHLVLFVPDAHCASCIRTIESGAKRVPGVAAARLNLSTRRLSVEWPVGEVAAGDVLAAVKAEGYEASPLAADDAAESGEDRTGRELLQAVAVAGFAMANVMLLSVSVWSGADDATRDLFHWISALIALPAIAWSGRPFFRSAWRALKARRTNMDVPISLGVLLASAMSLFETIHSGPHAYFDAAIALVFFLLTGRYLEHLMRSKARSAVTGLLAMSAKGATVIQDDGSRIYVPIGEVRSGMTVLVAAGERVPADGRVLDGASDVDRSSLTGEALPEPVSPGGLVHAGTLNLSGPLTVLITAAGEATLLAEIVRMMEAAESGRARYVDLAQRASRLYAPAVHTLAALTFLGWLWWVGDWREAMLAATAVLIITCPCALGLAVPAVRVVASGVLFRRGIMVKDGSALERLAEIDRVAFDKTGTLTQGRPRLIAPMALSTDRLALAHGLARQSRHPLSGAIAAFATERGVKPADVTEVRELAGLGLEGRAGGRLVRLGSRRWCGLTDDPGEQHAFGEVWFVVEGRSPMAFRFEDEPRADARATVDRLRRRGLPCEILSGDRRKPVAALASGVGIERFSAEWLPNDKAAHLAGLARSGHRVLMVGDGVNDAPALAAAHVSMAPSSAADIGQVAADFVFTGEGLAPIVDAYDLALKSRRLVLQNFALAIGYNAVAVPVAMLGHATPLIAAVAMSTSSLVVMLNAMRLRLGLPRAGGSVRKPAVNPARPLASSATPARAA